MSSLSSLHLPDCTPYLVYHAQSQLLSNITYTTIKILVVSKLQIDCSIATLNVIDKTGNCHTFGENTPLRKTLQSKTLTVAAQMHNIISCNDCKLQQKAPVTKPDA